MFDWGLFILITAVLVTFSILIKAIGTGGGVIVGVCALVIKLILKQAAFYYASSFFGVVVLIIFIAKKFSKNFNQQNNTFSALDLVALFGLAVPILLIYHLARRDDLGMDYNFDFFFILYYAVITSAFAVAASGALDNFAKTATHALTNKPVKPFEKGSYTYIGAIGAVVASLTGGLIYYQIELILLHSIVVTAVGVIAYVVNVFLSLVLFDEPKTDAIIVSEANISQNDVTNEASKESESESKNPNAKPTRLFLSVFTATVICFLFAVITMR